MRLPLLTDQGAGIQAFMGTILTLAAGNFDIVLLDEPEAFLHPPQARLLGRIVARMSQAGGWQVIVATHSDDLLHGILEASHVESEVSVVRLTRPTDESNATSQVSPDAIATLFRDPLLRFSNILDGIFYKGVVVCEAESDCTYYSAVLSHIEASGADQSSDLQFVHVGGKDRMPRAYAALKAAAVPTAVIADLDLLADRAKFRELLSAMGGSWTVAEGLYNTVESSVARLRQAPLRDSVRGGLREIVDANSSREIQASEATEIRALVKVESGWLQLKKKGAGAIDSGGPMRALRDLITLCRGVGLFLVAVGELERFHPDIPGSKQAWLTVVLEEELYTASHESQDFVGAVRSHIASAQGA